ncbi:hypothetical protein THIOKS1860021 [Thiocapsa sp. KS1]|nr:hypothetical protein THIOKS1860021 [Thiocapsa sp. KS1]
MLITVLLLRGPGATMRTDAGDNQIPIADASFGDPNPFGPDHARGEEYSPCASYPRH